MNGKRRVLLALALGCAGASLVARSEQRIELRARRFQFVPSEIRVAKGQTVTFAITAEDFVHGFNMPEFGVRKDLVPGKVVEVTITPRSAGRFHYLCDNFCGEGHDQMSGILVVT